MKVNQFVSSALALLSLTAASNVLADDSFQYEVAIEQARLDTHQVDIDQTTIGGLYYFSPVSTKGGPLAEAGFLSRTANMFALYQYNNIDSRGRDFSQSISRFGGTYSAKDNNLFARGAVTNFNASGRTDYDVSAGWYLDDSWLLSFDINYMDINHMDSNGSEDYTNWGISTKKLLTLDSGNTINLEAGLVQYDSDRSMYQDEAEGRYFLAGDYYFTDNFSVGVRHDWESKELFGDDVSRRTQIRSNWYFNDTMALNVSYTEASTSGSAITGDNLDRLGAGFSMRF